MLADLLCEAVAALRRCWRVKGGMAPLCRKPGCTPTPNVRRLAKGACVRTCTGQRWLCPPRIGPDASAPARPSGKAPPPEKQRRRERNKPHEDLSAGADLAARAKSFNSLGMRRQCHITLEVSRRAKAQLLTGRLERSVRHFHDRSTFARIPNIPLGFRESGPVCGRTRALQARAFPCSTDAPLCQSGRGR